MGGWRQRVKLEDGLKLDLKSATQAGARSAGQCLFGGIVWSYKYTDENIASGLLRTEFYGGGGSVRLQLGELERRRC